MMLSNFKIEDSISLSGEDFYFDLHNDYDLYALCFGSILDKNLVIFFTKTEGDWTKEDDPKQVRLEFEQIYLFEVSKNFFVEEKGPVTVEEIGFKALCDEDYDWLIRDEQREPNRQYHIVFRMSDLSYIRIGCKKIKVEEIPLIIQMKRIDN